MHANRRRRLLGAALGLVVGAAAGVSLLAAASGAGVAGGKAPAGTSMASPLEVTHLPPLLTTPGEAVELRYDVYCASEGDPTAACDAGGAVYLRTGDSGPFRELSLRLDPGAETGRYAVSVPPEAVRSGFSYYAVLRDNRTGASVTLPAGAAAAPQRSLALGPSTVHVDLGDHPFGAVRRADARALSAPWGDGPSRVGLEDMGPNATPIGASAFDVEQSGRVTVLDEAHRRLLRWGPRGGDPALVPLEVDGTLADMSVGPDGAVYVLESTSRSRARPVLRTFDPNGIARATTAVAEPGAAAVRAGPGGAVVLEHPSGEWMQVVSRGVGLGQEKQAQTGTAGRPVGDGQVVVFRSGNGELRIATTTSAGTIRRGWRITSSTPMAEVQLAQPLGEKLAVVVRLYSDTEDEFVALVLGASGIVRQFSIDSADWAETAPLARFRLAGSSLYQLGSSPAGIFVDRFDLGVS